MTMKEEVQAIMRQFKNKTDAIKFLRRAIEVPALRHTIMQWTGVIGYSQDCLEDLIFGIQHPEFVEEIDAYTKF